MINRLLNFVQFQGGFDLNQCRLMLVPVKKNNNKNNNEKRKETGRYHWQLEKIYMKY